jgi:hypothetical protein
MTESIQFHLLFDASVDVTDALYDPDSEEWPDDRGAVVQHYGQLFSAGDIYRAATQRYVGAFPRVECQGDGQRPPGKPIP